MKIAVTGHRPKDIGWGYDYSTPKWQELKEKIKDFLRAESCTEAITGMALGVDTIFAMAVLELKLKEKMAITLVAAVPCIGQASQWPDSSQRLYYTILNSCDEVHLINRTITRVEFDELHILRGRSDYDDNCMQARNSWMVFRCDMLLAIWSGKTTGGTAHAVHIAVERGKPFKVIAPSEIKGNVKKKE